MINWIVTYDIGPMDKILGYRTVLRDMRAFVLTGNVVRWEEISIYRDDNPTQMSPRTTVHFSNNNFQVDQINGRPINYNYPIDLPEFDAGAFPYDLPTQPKEVNANEKPRLLFLFAEAARSQVIQDKFERAFEHSGPLALEPLRVLANSYDDTCKQIHIDPAHPTRPLTCADYLAYAVTLPAGTPKRDAIQDLCRPGQGDDGD